MKVLFCDCPNSRCNYYRETFHALKEVFDISFVCKKPARLSELGHGWDVIILGFGHTDIGWNGKPKPLINDTNTPLFLILNKEYAALESKLNWIKETSPTAALTVQHEIDKYTKTTGIPFHRIMWSANELLFKNYGGNYEYDLFYSGVVRPEQAGDLRNRILQNLNKLKKNLFINYKLLINARYKKNNYRGKKFSPKKYAKTLSNSKIALTTTGPADLVGTRYFEIMAANRSLILCNRMEDPAVYSDMIIEDFNVVMFSTVDEFTDKAIYYLNNEDERMKIVNQACDHFTNNLTWTHRAEEIKKIILEYL